MVGLGTAIALGLGLAARLELAVQGKVAERFIRI